MSAARRAYLRLPRSALALGAAAALGLLGGCETVSLNGPAPVVVLHPAASAASAPAPAASVAAQPAAQAQGLQPTPGVEVQPLAPASAASLPAQPGASAPAAASAAPSASAPAGAAASAPPAASAPSPMASAPAPSASQPLALPPGAVRYVCNDGTSFLASFGDVSVTMSTALGVLQLEQTVAADGARYANGEVQVWFKGRQATISNLRNPGSAVLCLEQR
ncbi:MAG: MliC family protein [Betaproteobacteria bacterium]|nr:MliC family protein [Betaproteobacteria bacterium]MBU6511735.1 MliC family protein [Betaproteobacteria bacterium]MDE1954228.1 MliC family protein [Betaproteobacteria bacterium]MDE2151675.1 MliC family protein [Betaproteobacteria bacterium]